MCGLAGLARREPGRVAVEMLDRMAAVGGTLDVVSVVGQGTTVRGRAPASPTTTKPGSSIDPPDATRKGAGTTIQGCRPRIVGGARPVEGGWAHPGRPGSAAGC